MRSGAPGTWAASARANDGASSARNAENIGSIEMVSKSMPSPTASARASVSEPGDE